MSRPPRTAARSCCYRVCGRYEASCIRSPPLLLLAQTGAGDPLAHPRVTIMGTAECVIDPDGRAALKARSWPGIRNGRFMPILATLHFGAWPWNKRISTAGSRGPDISRRPLSSHRSTAGSLGRGRGTSACRGECLPSRRRRAVCGRDRGQARWAMAGNRDRPEGMDLGRRSNRPHRVSAPSSQPGRSPRDFAATHRGRAARHEQPGRNA